MKLRSRNNAFGLQPMSFDPEFEIKKNLLTAKHVDDINMAGTEEDIDEYTRVVKKEFGKCKLSKHQFTSCGVRYTMTSNHGIVCDQDEYIKTLRPLVHPELTGQAAEKEATKTISHEL